MKKGTKNTLITIITVLLLVFSVSIISMAEPSSVYDETESFTDEISTDSDAQIEFDATKFGDINLDGKISAADARLLLRCAANLEKVTEYILTYGDFSRDGKITAYDARTALRVAAHLEKLDCILYGHDYAEFVVDPTCTQDGYTTKKCTRCSATDESKENIVTTKGHKLVATTVNATCTTAGKLISKCSVCGYTEEFYTDAALGHSFSAWKESDTTRTRTCTRCNYSEVEKISTSNKVIYLTFDDGPGPYTKKLLGYLRSYNVKATFFVTNQNPGYIYLLKEMAADGHAIGVHTLTHNWSIYSSTSKYLSDFNAMHDIIKQQTGIDTKIFRFPGGTNNTVSRSYSKGIMTTLDRTMAEKGYLNFDWNVDCRDTEGLNSTQIADTTIAQIKNRNQSVVLMHDIKNSTVEAVPTIIKYAKNNGYTFKVIDETTPSVRFKPAN